MPFAWVGPRGLDRQLDDIRRPEMAAERVPVAAGGPCQRHPGRDVLRVERIQEVRLSHGRLRDAEPARPPPRGASDVYVALCDDSVRFIKGAMVMIPFGGEESMVNGTAKWIAAGGKRIVHGGSSNYIDIPTRCAGLSIDRCMAR